MDKRWMIQLFLIFIAVNSVQGVIRYWKHPHADLPIDKKITADGYPVEMHEIITEDDYILDIIRVPYGLERPASTVNRSAVLLVHGLTASADLYFTLGKRKALAYYLADRGFDVWALASRGSFPAKHKHFDSDKDTNYWDFSWHHIGVYDIPAALDHIISNTDQKQIFLIGHSAGNTAFFAMGSERPEYNDKVKIKVCHAPSTILSNIKYPFARLMGFLVNVIEKVVIELFGLKAFLPQMEVFRLLLKELCTANTMEKACSEIINFIGGSVSRLYDNNLTTLIFNSVPETVASMEVIHYMQLVNSGGFKQYDYGVRKNLQMYGRRSPPDYSFKNCSAPVAFMYAKNDVLATEEGVFETIKLLPNVVLVYKVPYEDFTHTDFLFAKNASKLVYERTFQLLKDYDNGKIEYKRYVKLS